MAGGGEGLSFDGPAGRASLLDLFEGRRQLIIYRAFFEPGVYGWPEHACVGCSLMADQAPPYQWWHWHDAYGTGHEG